MIFQFPKGKPFGIQEAFFWINFILRLGKIKLYKLSKN